MCGIAGIHRTDGRSVEPRRLEAMGDALARRGPDGRGTHLDPRHPGIGLVSRRLAVIDVAGGQQPMSTPDGRLTIVYNGEIYNAAELRRELEAHGHAFRTRCDTEVVLHGYREWGRNVATRLNGMWAFAIWDAHERILHLSRDRLGIKPLVYAESPHGLIFASEIKALIASGLVSRELDPQALPHYLSSFVVPEPLTFLRGIRRLPAGHTLTVDASGSRVERYWDCAAEEEADRGLDAYREEVRALLEDSIRRQQVSDVPLGVFLSGGTDSALVAALAARSSPDPIRTFTLGFDGDPGDERSAARAISSLVGSVHTETGISAREAVAALPEVLALHDEPSQSLLQAHFVSRLARTRVTVALAGVGGDELFASYPTHRAVDLLARLDRLPPTLRALALHLARAVGGRRGANLSALAAMPPDDRVTRWLMHQTSGPLRRSLLAPELAAAVDHDAPARHFAEHYERTAARDPLNRLLYVYLKTYLVDELLRTLDTMTMAHSVEARVPLLDHRLVELAVRMPAHHKMSLREGKVVLRRVAEAELPAARIDRRKRGFTLPLDRWLRAGELTEMLRDLTSEASQKRRGVFDPDAVRALVDRYLDGDRSLVQPVMMLFTFELWARGALDRPAAAVEERVPAVSSPAEAPAPLSVVLVNWNTREILRNCLRSIEAHLGVEGAEIIVVDNASDDGSATMVADEFPRVRLIRNSANLGFARANNQAMKIARGEWFLLLNSDTLLTDDSIACLLSRARSEPGLGVAQCRLVHSDGRLQYSTYRFPSLRLAVLEDLLLYKLLSAERRAELLLAGYWRHDAERDVDWISGALMLLSRRVYEDTGGFSEAYFMYGEDMEWCYRIRKKGWRIRYYPEGEVVHLDHQSSAIRWGERRVAICIERQLAIYESQAGPVRGFAYNLVRTLGVLVRAGYFSARTALGGDQTEYWQAMARYYAMCVRVHLAIVTGRR